MKTDFLSKIAVNKSLLKEYCNNDAKRLVYLNDGEEFQIQLFNPNKYNIGAKIYVNDDYLGNIIVIKPGQRIWLERYLDSSNKFKFSTYTVENTAESKNAIKNNGNIKIEFFNEIKPRSFTYTYNNIYDYPTLTANYSSSVDNMITSTGAWATASCDCMYNDSKSCVDINEIDTGRIEKGSYSTQSFKDINIDFCNYPFSTENIKILPMSQKRYCGNDLKKIYCHECGRRIKEKFKFCPFCGAKQ